jgi:hypothetical protein
MRGAVLTTSILALLAVALVWAAALVLRRERWGWASALIRGALAFVIVTAFTLPAILV